MSIAGIAQRIRNGLSLWGAATRYGGIIRKGVLVPNQRPFALNGSILPIPGLKGESRHSLARRSASRIARSCDDPYSKITVVTGKLGIDDRGKIVFTDTQLHVIKRSTIEPRCEGHNWGPAPYGCAPDILAVCTLCGRKFTVDDMP